MTRVTSDVDAINDLFTSGVVSVFGDVLSLLGIIVVLVSLDWRLALLTFCVLPLILLVTQWFRRNVRESYREVRTWVARLNAFLQESLTGMATVQLFRREERAFADFDHVNSEHRDANLRSIYYYAVFYPAIELIGALSTALILWFGGAWVLGGTLTIGTLVAFIQYAQRFFRPISDMSEKFNLLQAAMASSERLFGLLDTPVTITDPGAGYRVPGTRANAERRTPNAERRNAERRRGRACRAGAGRRPRRRGHTAGECAGRHRSIVVDDVSLCLHAGRGRVEARVVRRGARAADRHRRGDGLGQEHADQPAPALLRRVQRAHPDRWPRHPGAAAGRPALAFRPRAAGRLSVLWHGRRQHPAGSRRHHGCAGPRGR